MWVLPTRLPLLVVSFQSSYLTDSSPSIARALLMTTAHAIVSCPLGPQITTYIGRTDSSTAAPEGELPDHTDPVDEIIAGFTARDLAALIGAHSTAKQFFVEPDKAGEGFDLTPGTWDVTYYGQVETGLANFVLDSDKAMSQDSDIGPFFALFTVDQVGWTVAFVPAWEKMAALGGPDTSEMIDCTSALPSTTIVKRGITAKSFSSRFRWWGS
jgi:manganese peroxidase